MEVLTIVIQWFLVASGVLWVGASALLDFVILPIIERLPPETQRTLGRKLGRILVLYFTVTATATILFGILRGTLFGPIRTFPALLTPYGMTWIAALILAAALALLGGLGVGRTFIYYYDTDELWRPNDANRSRAARTRRHLLFLSRLQLAGFGLVLVCMQLMAESFS